MKQTATRGLTGRRVAKTPSVTRVCASAKAGNWLPGSDTPAYLDGLAGCVTARECACQRGYQTWCWAAEGRIASRRRGAAPTQLLD